MHIVDDMLLIGTFDSADKVVDTIVVDTLVDKIADKVDERAVDNKVADTLVDKDVDNCYWVVYCIYGCSMASQNSQCLHNE